MTTPAASVFHPSELQHVLQPASGWVVSASGHRFGGGRRRTRRRQMIRNVHQAVTGVATAARITTEGVHESGRTATELARVSIELRQVIDQFTL